MAEEGLDEKIENNAGKILEEGVEKPVEKPEEKYKPNFFIRSISYVLSKFPEKKNMGYYEKYSKDVIAKVLHTGKLESIVTVNIPDELKKAHKIDEQNIEQKSLNLFLTSTVSLSRYYALKSLNKLVGILIRAEIGSLPKDVIKSVSRDLKDNYHIDEKPQTYVKYSIVVGAINAAVMMAAAYGLLHVPWIGKVSQLKLYMTQYTLFVETPIRAGFLYLGKKPLGILPLEGGAYALRLIRGKQKKPEQKNI
jgi:hypothetical protein